MLGTSANKLPELLGREWVDKIARHFGEAWTGRSLGCGFFGCALELKNARRTIKLTLDKKEPHAAVFVAKKQKAGDGAYDAFVRIHGVVELGKKVKGHKVWAIYRDEVTPIGKEPSEKLLKKLMPDITPGRALAALHKLRDYRSYAAFMDGEQRDEEIRRMREDAVNEFHFEIGKYFPKIARALAAYRTDTGHMFADAWADNLGVTKAGKDNLVIFDLGYSVGKRSRGIVKVNPPDDKLRYKTYGTPGKSASLVVRAFDSMENVVGEIISVYNDNIPYAIDGKPSYYINSFTIRDKTQRGKGVGQRMLVEMIRLATSSGCPLVSVHRRSDSASRVHSKVSNKKRVVEVSDIDDEGNSVTVKADVYE
jgi:ribosomal protein S18 acetylase RimI-like enzyme